MNILRGMIERLKSNAKREYIRQLKIDLLDVYREIDACTEDSEKYDILLAKRKELEEKISA